MEIRSPGRWETQPRLQVSRPLPRLQAHHCVVRMEEKTVFLLFPLAAGGEQDVAAEGHRHRIAASRSAAVKRTRAWMAAPYCRVKCSEKIPCPRARAPLPDLPGRATLPQSLLAQDDQPTVPVEDLGVAFERFVPPGPLEALLRERRENASRELVPPSRGLGSLPPAYAARGPGNRRRKESACRWPIPPP